MRLGVLRVAALSVGLAGASAGCVDQARCDEAESAVARARVEAAQRELRMAWVQWQEATFLRQIQARDAMREDVWTRRIRALEATNAELAARLERAEQRAYAADPREGDRDAIGRKLTRAAPTRTLDPVIPYRLTGVDAPEASGDAAAQEIVKAGHKAPVRKLDETVPYE